MKSYRERVGEFWQWFEQNEAKLADYIDNIREKNYDPDEIVAFFSEGLNIAIQDCAFNLGGKREVNLTPEGNRTRVFLTSYLVNSMPEKFKDSWFFMPWKNPVQGCSLRIHDVDISADDILLSVTEDNGEFSIEFYNETLNALDENQAYNICFIMLDLSLGENIAMSFIKYVDKANEKQDGMIKLSELRQYMDEHTENGIDDNYNPTERYSTYSFEPTENDSTPRYDIIAGFSRMTPIMQDYYNKESNVFELLKNNGAKAAFISIDRTSDDHKIDLDIRNTIVDRIEAEIPAEIGTIIGQAIGVNYTYIDLLLYDESAFMEAIKPIIKGISNINYYDFLIDAEPQRMA